MPYALSMGVDYNEFWHLTPRALRIIAEGYKIANNRQLERENAIAHLHGIYFSEALMATVGNMLSGKNAKKHKYPDKPYDLRLEDNNIEKQEREKEKTIELFAAQLTARMNNFNLNSSKKQGQS